MQFLNPPIGFNAYTASYTGTAGTTTTWLNGPKGVMVWSTTPCYVIVGVGVTATTSNGTPIPAYTPIPFVVPREDGSPWCVSAIKVADDGVIYCKPINE